jgi:putative tryptophan/tyrosine transport system substrate-binding protein
MQTQFRFVRLFLVLTIIFLVPSCSNPSSTGTKTIEPETQKNKSITLGIVQIAQYSVLDTFREAVIQGLNEQGFVEGKNLVIDYQNAQGDINTLSTIVSKFESDKVDVIFCISTPACIATAKAADTIPVVFGFVTDPIGAGLVTQMKNHGGNITGVQATRPIEGVLTMIGDFMPSARNIGIISNQSEPNSQYEISHLKQYTDQMNLGLVFVQVNASAVSEVFTAAQSLVGRVDAIYIPGDNVAKQGIASIIQVCETNKIPCFGSEQDDIASGVIAVYMYYAQDYGHQAAAILARVLHGEKPGAIDVGMASNFSLSINTEAAKRMDFVIPQQEIEKASRIYP